MGKPIPRPFLKWAGGKGALTDLLLAHLPPSFRTYHEPFLGGEALFFALYQEGRITRVVLSDLNPELMDTYRALRDCPLEVIRTLETYTYNRETYYHLRALDPWALSLPERAARMIYLNKTGYNGLYRLNRKGKFNVPFGRYRSPNYLDRENLLAVSRALQGVELITAPFERVLERAKPGDLVYFDPPYVPLSKTASFTGYLPGGFSLEDHKRLKEVCLELTARGVHVMLSNSDTPPVRTLYSAFPFRLHGLKAKRSISRTVSGRKEVFELLITNY